MNINIINSIKKQQRVKHKQIRKDFTTKEKAKYDEKIFENLKKYISENLDKQFDEIDNILLYYSIDIEVSTQNYFEFFKQLNKNIYFPKCLDSDGHMEFYMIEDLNELKKGAFNIFEPDSSKEKFNINNEKSIIIVPAMAFNENCFRLGFGKGFYDRYLKKFKGRSIILCYEKNKEIRMVLDDYDEFCDCVITDKNIYLK